MRLPPMAVHRDKLSTPAPSLHSRLILADQMSLSILGSDTAAMLELYESWTDIETSLEEAIANGTATPDILALASKVASRTAYIAGTGIALYQEVGALNASFSDMRALFHELSLEDKPSGKTPVRHDPTKAFPLPAYIRPAYVWLLANLHNPYPSKDVKRAISTETSTSITYVENWFTDVRKKIGWTTLMKSRFHNKRSLIVEAATRIFQPLFTVFKSDDFNALASTSQDFNSAFHQIEDNVKNLYGDKLYETNLALNIVDSKDPSSPAEPDPESRTIEASLSPSPSPSPSASYSSPRPEELPQTCSRKRRSTHSPDAEDTLPRSHKRTRYASPQETICNTPTSVSSPPLSVVEICAAVAEASPRLTLPVPSSSFAKQGKRKRQTSVEIDLDQSPILLFIRENSVPISNSAKRKRISSDSVDSSPTLPAVPSVPSDATPSRSQTRKRRLSDATGERLSKRPHGVPSAPRLQTVSDPYPVPKPVNPPSDFDLWWSSSIASGQPITLGLPEPVTIEPILLDDSIVPLDIAWNTGVVVPPTAPTFVKQSWTELVQDGVHEIDSIFTNFLDPKVFERQYDADLFPQATNQNPFGFDSINILPMPTTFAPDALSSVNQNLSLASIQPELGDSSRFYNTTLLNPTELLQSLYTPARTPTQPDHSTVNGLGDKSAKAAKIQRLREELQRLEAEVV